MAATPEAIWCCQETKDENTKKEKEMSEMYGCWRCGFRTDSDVSDVCPVCSGKMFLVKPGLTISQRTERIRALQRSETEEMYYLERANSVFVRRIIMALKGLGETMVSAGRTLTNDADDISKSIDWSRANGMEGERNEQISQGM